MDLYSDGIVRKSCHMTGENSKIGGADSIKLKVAAGSCQ